MSPISNNVFRRIVEFLPRRPDRRHHSHDDSTKVRSAHFFGEHDPFSFWTDQQLERNPRMLQQIKADGFNTIILVVPLFPFMPDVGPAQVDLWYLQRFDAVLSQCDGAELNVVLRINYPHSSTPQAFHASSERTLALARSSSARLRFSVYAQALASIAKRHRRFSDVFLCWEDVWVMFAEVPNQTEAVRRQFAEQVGFASRLVPPHGSPEIVDWMMFFDDFVHNTLGNIVRDAFGNVSFELRADKYPLHKNKDIEWLSFQTRSGSNDTTRYCYWAPYFGARNKGESLNAREAIGSLNYLIDSLSEPNNLVIEQFNFTDNGLMWAAANARIDGDELPTFFAAAAPVLAARTKGYGVWAYRDYRENWIYNSTFQRGVEDWSLRDAATIVDQGIALSQGGRVNKWVCPATRAQAPRQYYEMCMLELELADTQTGTVIECCVDGRPIAKHPVADGLLEIAVPVSTLPWDGFELEFRCFGKTMVRRVGLFGFVQRGGLYDHHGNPGPHLSLIRGLNAQITDLNESVQTGRRADTVIDQGFRQ